MYAMSKSPLKQHLQIILISFLNRLRKRILFHLILVMIGFLLAATQILAQQGTSKPDLKFQRIHDGLTGNLVTTLLQDHRGFIWVGTTRGLHRFDGIQFTVYSSDPDSTSISHNYIYTIYEDTRNQLWMGTGNGVSRYNLQTDDFTRFELPYHIADHIPVSSILEDDNGTLWVAGGGSGLYYFDTETGKFLPFTGIDHVTVNSMTGGNNHLLWLATTESGIIKLDTQTKQIQSFTHDPANPHSISSNSVEVVQIDHSGAIWAGTQGWGLNKMKNIDGEIRFIRYLHDADKPGSLSNNDISTLYLDKNDNLWIGNINGGLHLYNKTDDSFFHYDSDPLDLYSLSHNSIESIYQDSQGRYWIGTALSGINMADPFESKFERYYSDPRNPNSLNNNIVRDFFENEDGTVWIATDGGGINFFDRQHNRFSHFKLDPGNPNSLSSDAVISLNKDSFGNLWAGTWGGGANLLLDQDNGVFTTFNRLYNIHEYPIRHIFDIHFDENYIWLAAFNEGLYRYDVSNGNIQLFTHISDNPTTLSSNYLIRIFEDSGENLWIATEVGLNKIKAENREQVTVRRYLHSPDDPASIANVSIRQIFEDSRQNIWIATEGGLSRYEPHGDHFINYSESDGLPSDEISSIIEDDNGMLWIGTLKGISRFNPVDHSFMNFDRSHGLLSDEFSRYAVGKTQAGELLFGGMNGFNLFQPDDLQANPYPPPVFLTDFRLFNRTVDLKDPESPLQTHISVVDTLVLTHRQNSITFDFTALNYTRPEFNQYAFMVDGFDVDWNYVGNQRNATYTNLHPGSYVFRVKASNNDGIWNEEGVSLALIIQPPFWQTTWFYLLTILLAGMAITASFRYRVRSIREQNKKLELQVAERTAEIKQKNIDLTDALGELEAAKDELVEKAHIAGMADIASGVLHNVGNILNSVNTSTSLIKQSVYQSKIEGLFKANSLLREHIDQIDQFIAENPKGKELLKYYLMLENPLQKERDDIISQANRLEEKINLIKEVISAQQTYAGATIQTSQTNLDEMIENSISLMAGSIDRHGLIVRKNLKATSPILAQRSRLIHVLVNIFKNAKEAMEGKPPEEKMLFVETREDTESVYLTITDNGPGINPNYLDKIFTQGFTTKKNGHGFGLHSSANYVAEMGGSIQVSNSEKGGGATFTITFPLTKKNENGIS